MPYQFGYYNNPFSYGGFNAPTAPAQTPPTNLPPTNATAPSGFMCRPVTSRAEAEVFQIPFDGSTTYFVDTANGKIYSKTFNFNNGTAPLVTYIRESDVPVPQYATVDDLNALREELTKKAKAVKKSDPDE